MPRFGKKSLSLFLRTKCERQFVSSLYSKQELKDNKLPIRQESRFGLGLVGGEGYKWQHKKIKELILGFGKLNVQYNAAKSDGGQPDKIDLVTTLPLVTKPCFIIEAKYQSGNEISKKALGLENIEDRFGDVLDVSNSQLDILQIMIPLIQEAKPDELSNPALETANKPYRLGVNPDGTLFQLDDKDKRFRLRIIDIKRNSDPGHNYFAEVVYYSMTLAGWLKFNNLDDKFVVIAAAAIWAGSYEDNSLIKTYAEYKEKGLNVPFEAASEALNDSLLIAVFEVYAPRLKRFLSEELPPIIKKPWDALDWHVDQRCKGCEMLGYKWTEGEIVSKRLCLPDAKAKDHLSRVYGLTPGSRKFLNKEAVRDVHSLAQLEATNPIFNNHQILRSKRNVFPARAKVLQSAAASIIEYSGSDALMPKYADLKIYIFLDYDLSSAITSVFGVQANWTEPLPYGSELKKRDEANKKKWTYKFNEETGIVEEERFFFVDKGEIGREREEFIKFLKRLKEILNSVVEADREDTKAGRRTKDGRTSSENEFSTYQIYLWDKSQYKHLVRLIERHLIHILLDEDLRGLAWLFPPPQLLQSADEATRKTPFTFVADVIKNTVAVPLPHHYTLLEVAEYWKLPGVALKQVNAFYLEPMSDLIPAERILNLWNRGDQWEKTLRGMEFTQQQKLKALIAVVSKTEIELKDKLSSYSAPNIYKSTRQSKKIAPLSQLWLEYMRLDEALNSLENNYFLSMPVHEKEAKLKAARLLKRVNGEERAAALENLGLLIGRDITKNDYLMVYKLRPGSEDVNIKPGDINFALSPEKKELPKTAKAEKFPRFLDTHISNFIKGGHLVGTKLAEEFENKLKFNKAEKGTINELGITEVSVEVVDRTNGYIALKPNYRNRMKDLEKHPNIDFSVNVVLDKVHRNYLLKKLEPTLNGIGFFESVDDDKIFGTLRDPNIAIRKKISDVPATKVFWETSKMAEEDNFFNTVYVKKQLQDDLTARNKFLDFSQWKAWEKALTHKFSLIWGPPGTGKSWTLRAIIRGALLDAQKMNRPLRLLITAGTNTAIENVLYALERDMAESGSVINCNLIHALGRFKEVSSETKLKHPNLKVLTIDDNDLDNKIETGRLIEELNNPKAITVVGCLPQQLHNLAVFGMKKYAQKDFHTIRSWFDLIILDEASQIDIATTTLIYSKLDSQGSTVLAGDNLQLPPIQKAKHPRELEYLVGSAYDFFRSYRNIEPAPLDVNYRSNKTIVDLTKEAGYSSELESYSPDLKLNILRPIPIVKPGEWNPALYWSQNWSKFLDPDKSVTCFVYDDTESSQINDFEADSIALLIWFLQDRLNNQLLDDKTNIDSQKVPKPYTPNEFWEKAVGVVVPHRAQMSKIISKLQSVFPAHPTQSIRDAVDTVERFQGQQRDVIFCSFGIGDADIVSAEDEFLYNLNRFNVISSRSRAKFIVFITRTLLDHLSDDQKILAESRLIKKFAEQFCNKNEVIELGYINKGNELLRRGQLRWNQSDNLII